MTTDCDFIVIGAGSAGCVVARVLAERGFSITLVEAGQDLPTTRTPALYPQAFGSCEDWKYQSVPQSGLSQRRIRLPAGRGCGGSTRINAMIWYRPLESDFNSLALAGGRAWSVDRSIHSLQAVEQWVRPEPARWLSEATQRFLSTAVNHQFACHSFLRMTRGGRRLTAADLLAGSDAAAQVKIITANVSRLRVRRSRACGVDLIKTGHGQAESIAAKLGVVVSCGAIGSPALLIRSGIGPAALITAQGATVEPLLAREQVGANLSDHLIMPIVYAAAPQQRFPSPSDCRALARFQIGTTGPLASNLAEAGGIFSLTQDLPSIRRQVAPDTSKPWAQIHFTPTHYLLHPDPAAPSAITIGVSLCHPRSRGHVRLWPSLEPVQRAYELEIDPAYLSVPEDQVDLMRAIRIARDLAQQLPLASFHYEELIPGAKRSTDESLLRSISRYAQTLYHPTGTCRMGQDDASVVDESLAVRGVTGLHVVDASVLPTTPSVNPNALVMTLAWHASQRIAESAL